MGKKKMLYRVENIVRKGEIACYKQFLLFSQCFPQLYTVSLVRQKGTLCGNGRICMTVSGKRHSPGL